MKKSILLSTALFVGVGAFAQTNVRNLPPKLSKHASPYSVDNQATLLTGKSFKPTVNSVQATSVTFTDSRNGFGTLVEETSPLHYNADLNMLAFTHRLPTTTAWPDLTGLPTTGVSGFMVTNTSTDNGATWSGACYYQNGTYWGRYPSGVIANAPGNTDAAQARLVAVGPCTGSGSTWHGGFFASTPANTTGNVTTNDQQGLAVTASAGTAAKLTYFPSYNTVVNGTTVWTGARKVDEAIAFKGVAVLKGTLSGGSYVWTQDSTTFNLPWVTNSAGASWAVTAPKIAFGPDGLTGYVVVNGAAPGTNVYEASSLKPHVWKTTDGGATWSIVNANYDWNVNHPEILCNLMPTRFDSTWNASGQNLIFPAFFDSQGGGVTVDANGKLHYVTTIISTYSSNPDSMLYTYNQAGFGYTQYEVTDRPWIYDLTTDGNGTWTTKIIGQVYTRNIETTDLVPDPAAWTTDGTTPMDYVNRIKVSRSTDGTKIFYSWTDSDTTNIVSGAYHANTTPSIYYRGYDVTSGNFSPIKEANANDAVENGFYNYYSSPVARPVAGGYSIPVVYISSQDGALNATNPVDFNYIQDLNILNTEYTVAITPNVSLSTACSSPTVGVKEVTGSTISFVGQNYPNPFNGATNVNVNLNKAEVITVTVTNSIGQVVAVQTVKGIAGENKVSIDAASLTNGVYFYSVVAGNSKVTRKMSVVK